MNKKIILICLLITITTLIISCSSIDSKKDSIAYISANPKSTNQKVFTDLNLGTIFDYNFKLTKADKSWVNFWIEGYENGEKMEPFVISELSYGLSPNEIEEGNIGFGLLKNEDSKYSSFFYTPYIKSVPSTMDEKILKNDTQSMIGYAIGSEKVGLNYGEEKIIGIYRQKENSIRSYDYTDSSSIDKIIENDDTVLLLKIKISEKIKDDN